MRRPFNPPNRKNTRRTSGVKNYPGFLSEKKAPFFVLESFAGKTFEKKRRLIADSKQNGRATLTNVRIGRALRTKKRLISVVRNFRNVYRARFELGAIEKRKVVLRIILKFGLNPP